MKIRIFPLIAALSIPAFLQAQQHFNFTSNTGSNATIMLPASANPQVNGAPIENGDEIGLFRSNGLCCGAAVWQGQNLAITAWGDDSMTPDTIDGFVQGDTIYYRSWDASQNLELDSVEVTYLSGGTTYQNNGLYVLSSFHAYPEPQPQGVPWEWTTNTGNNATIMLPTTANPIIQNQSIQTGDWVGVFRSNSLCCGAAEWQGQNLAITAWGDDSMTPDTIDGFQQGDTLYYWAWDASDSLEIPSADVTYSSGIPVYQNNGLYVIASFVANLNQPPVVISPIDTVHLMEDGWGSINLSEVFTDPDGDSLEFDVGGNVNINVNIYYSIDSSYAYLYPDTNWNGNEELIFSAYDGEFYAHDTTTVVVTPLNDPPAIDPVPNHSMNAGETFNYQVTADDPDLYYEGDTLTFSDNSPLFDIEPFSGWIHYTAQQGDEGEYDIMIWVTDTYGAADSTMFHLSVNSVLIGLELNISQINAADFPNIDCYVTVEDSLGNIISGLTDTNFTVWEDWIMPSSITVTEYGGGMSLISAGLVMDYSGSMSEAAINNMETACSTFVRQMNLGDRGAIVKFSNDVYIVQPFTGNHDSLIHHIQATFPGSNSATALYNAIYQTIGITIPETSRKSIIALTDGQDNASSHTIQQVIDYAQANSIPIYTIGLGDNINQEALRQIADSTGGEFYLAPSSSQLAQIYQAIAQSIESEYLIEYVSPNPVRNGSVRSVVIRTDYSSMSAVDTSAYTAPLSPDPPWILFNPTGITTQMIIQNATLDRLPIVIGDWVGVFDVDGCAGMTQYNGNYPLSIPLIMEYILPGGGVLPGATPGNPIQYRLWHEGEEYTNFSASYSMGGSIFGSPLTVVDLLQFTSAIRFQIVLINNFVNAVSFPGQPYPSADIEDIMRSLNYPDSLVLVQDDSGRAYIPRYGINNIGEVNITRGYQVYTTAPEYDTINYNYLLINPDSLPVVLYPNFVNLIGYPLFVPQPVDTCLASVVDSILLVWNEDGEAYIPSMGITTLDTLFPGEGYYAYTQATAAVSFTYPDPYDGARDFLLSTSPVICEKREDDAPFEVVKTGKPFFCLLNMASLLEQNLCPGDEVGIFDGELCVGWRIIENTNVDWLSLTAWERDDLIGLPGFTAGNPIRLMAWKASSDDYYSLEATFSKPEQKFFKGDIFSTAHIVGMILGALSGEPDLPVEYGLHPNYPNPFNASTIISYQIPAPGQVEINIYNILGELIRRWSNVHSSGGNFRINWDGMSETGKPLSSGIYMCVMKAGDFRANRKLLLVK